MSAATLHGGPPREDDDGLHERLGALVRRYATIWDSASKAGCSDRLAPARETIGAGHARAGAGGHVHRFEHVADGPGLRCACGEVRGALVGDVLTTRAQLDALPENAAIVGTTAAASDLEWIVDHVLQRRSHWPNGTLYWGQYPASYTSQQLARMGRWRVVFLPTGGEARS